MLLRVLPASLFVLLAARGIEPQAFIHDVQVIANGDFEQSVASTSSGGGTVFGSYWIGAEGKVFNSGEAPPPTGHGKVLALTQPGEHVMQRFAAYEYLAQEAGGYEGASSSTVITGELAATDERVQMQVILEENRHDMNAGSWGFYQESMVSGPLGDDWIYLARDTGTSAHEAMTWVPPGGSLPAYLGTYQADGAVIRLNSQIASSDAAPVRAYVAPRDGRLLVQARIVIDRDGPQPSGSVTKASITVFDNYPDMNQVEQILSATIVPAGDGMFVSAFVDVEEGNVVGFETLELGAVSSFPYLRFDPQVSYDARKVVYRFGQDFPSVTSDELTWYSSVTPIGDPNTWQAFELDAGQDFEDWFSQFEDFDHGPQPQLSVRLELLGKDAPNAIVAFDGIEVTTGFRSQTEQGLTDEIKSELDRIIDNHFEHGVGIDSGTSAPNPHVRYLFQVGDGTQTSLPASLAGQYGSLSELVASYSTQFLHVDATPWLLREVDRTVRNRDPVFGALKKFNFTTSQYEDLEPGDNVLASRDLGFLLSVYDFSNDIHTLDMAYELGLDMLDWGGSAGSDLIQGSFTYEEELGNPILEPHLTPAAFEYAYLGWAGSMTALAALAVRTEAYPSRYARYDELLPAATGIAAEIEDIVASYGGYNPYWMGIDNPLDDQFGYQSWGATVAYDESPESDFVSVISQGVLEFQPEWVQTFPRGASMAGDQERAWGGWLVYFEQNPSNRLAFGKAYVDATLNYVRTGQLGNGVWGGVNSAAHQQPDLGGQGGTPVVPADAHRLRPLARAWGDPTLAAQGLVSSELKDDLLAYFTTTWHLNAVHFGHYLEYLNETSDQLGYMRSAAYPDPLDADATVNAGQEFRALSAGPGMLARLEPELSNQRPTASISPAHFGITSSGAVSGQGFTITDPDGWSDLVIIQIVMTELQGTTVTDEQTWFVGSTSDLTPHITSPTSVSVTWANPPTLASGRDYRFVITTLDGDYRWDMDTALYEIP